MIQNVQIGQHKVKALKRYNVGIRLSQEQRSQLDTYCLNEGKSISHVLRQLMKDNIFVLSGER